jgi:hypothetical protein
VPVFHNITQPLGFSESYDFVVGESLGYTSSFGGTSCFMASGGAALGAVAVGQICIAEIDYE